MGQNPQCGQEVSLHPHYAHHHPDQFHNHNQPLQLDMPKGNQADLKKNPNSLNHNSGYDFKRSNYRCSS